MWVVHFAALYVTLADDNTFCLSLVCLPRPPFVSCHQPHQSCNDQTVTFILRSLRDLRSQPRNRPNHQSYSSMQRQTAVTAYLKSKQLLLFVFAGQCKTAELRWPSACCWGRACTCLVIHEVGGQICLWHLGFRHSPCHNWTTDAKYLKSQSIYLPDVHC